MLELRSDTFTRPTPGMLQAMFSAQVGDDVFEEDPTVKVLEEKCASLFGYEAGLFCVSGTMANQVAINVHVRQGDEVICDQLSHIHLYEGGGVAANSMAALHLLQGDRGRITAAQIREVIKADNVHYPVSRLVSLENTVNKGGGACYDLQSLRDIKALCLQENLALHLDGARIFNALIETGQSPLDYGKLFDSISVCLSKGLGAPVGSVLLGSKSFIHRARRVRKRLGGGLRQVGYLAAAGIYALDHHREGLKEDHRRAREIAEVMKTRPEVKEVLPVDTNIVLFELQPGISAGEYSTQLLAKGIRVLPFYESSIRMVTHLDFTDEDLSKFKSVMTSPD
ncbi:MAG: PLP-dependent transferase [Chitinophagaceae bacterium]|nr:PLP-dependent transferase [Chitinophagaceae bacterium]